MTIARGGTTISRGTSTHNFRTFFVVDWNSKRMTSRSGYLLRNVIRAPLQTANGQVHASPPTCCFCTASEDASSMSGVLGPQIVRDIVYRVLQHESGGGSAAALRALAIRNDRFLRVSRVLQRIYVDSTPSPSIEDLMKSASMSVSTFHPDFEAVTATSPR